MMMRTITTTKVKFILRGASRMNATSGNVRNYCHTAAPNWPNVLGNKPPLTAGCRASLRLHFLADAEEAAGDPACHTLCFLSSQDSTHTRFEGCFAQDGALRLQVFQVTPPQFPSQPAPKFPNRIQMRRTGRNFPQLNILSSVCTADNREAGAEMGASKSNLFRISGWGLVF